ncbi:RusA family crossover junction endodeoxyribonuclease [Nocardiopsis tropica]|uniref:RusA family crossover junction endodeoxyribonuclease n=1 Tax=Nocardiopsis tropica TaxID=109330 RepID=UPI002E88D448|nr:RusA family crossover junction endodeoxyribonuclease [Nocardiopsis tropica]
MTVTVTVYGTPVGQGAISYNKQGKGYHRNARVLDTWRDTVRDVTLHATGRHLHAAWKTAKAPCARCGIRAREHAVFLGPVAFAAVVTLPPVPSDPDRAWPLTRSSFDWDHHGRALSDALSGVLWADDSQIVDGRVRKTYPDQLSDSLDRPGVLLRAWDPREAT